MALEVGKNRMEALGDCAETADLIRYACDQMEANNGYIVEMGKDPLVGYHATNISVLRPYGVWLVISPFNFPPALTGGPVGAALVAGNTVVIKPATDTPWIVAPAWPNASAMPVCRMACSTSSPVPGSTLGQALVDSPEVDGVTFTGSFDVGMKMFRDFADGRWVRPTILELGGKNPAIVSRHADLERAAHRHRPLRLWPAGAEMLGLLRGSLSKSRSTMNWSKSLARADQQTDHRRSDRAASFLGPVINQAAYQISRISPKSSRRRAQS